MAKMDVTGWKEFRVGDLFEATLSDDDIQCKDYMTGNIPLVSSGKNNNGIVAYIENSSAKLWKSGVLTVDMFGKVFYQPKSFYCVSHGRVNILLPKVDTSEFAMLFIASVIERVTLPKYEFKDLCTGKILLKEKIKLPVDGNGNPDWQYMEDYMRKVDSKIKRMMDDFDTVQEAGKKKVDVLGWKEFRIGDLFNISSAKGKNSQMLNDGSDIPYFAASKENNGFNRMVSVVGFEEWVSKGNCIQLIHIGDAAAGYANYISDDFIAMNGKSSCAYNGNMNRFSGLFISSVICIANKGKYSFKEPWTVDKVLNTYIKLPADSNGNPDWQYMEDYMREQERRVQSKLDLLSA